MTAPKGFTAGGVTAGLKASGRPDLALVLSEVTATAAVTMTTNQVRAAPCVITARNAADGQARAVVINSGSANACTGTEGLADAEATTDAVARAVGCAPHDVLVASTGLIGMRLDMDRIRAGIARVATDLSADGGGRAADAICTTDTTTKQVAYRAIDRHGSCVVGGMAKGAGMIAPAMATMLAVVTTDAPVVVSVLRSMVRQAVARTFNRISVDACGSTNDTVAVLANGQARRPPGLQRLAAAIHAVCADLAQAVVADGEGATKVAHIRVTSAPNEEHAAGVGRTVAASALVRAALHGADPNWGRILAAMGTAPVGFDPGRVSIAVGAAGISPVTLCRFGTAAAFDEDQAAAVLSKPEVVIDIDLDRGPAQATVLTADLSPAYVTDNAYYTT